MRGTQLARQWRMLRLLESQKRGMTAADLAHELETPIRTVYRDLEALEDAGFPICTEAAGRSSYWKLMEGFKTNFPLPLTRTELMSLHMSRDILRIFEGTVFQESIESLFAKVRASLPREAVQYMDNVSERLKVGLGPSRNYNEFKKNISIISDATAEKKRIEILYNALSTGEESLRKVDPYQVWVMNGSFYLIGLCHLRNAVRTFAMDRIKSLTVLDEAFRFPKDFSLEGYLRSAFRVMRGQPEKVTVRLDAQAAHVARERKWHPTQELSERQDGGLVITLEVPISYEIISWILGFGSAAQVLEPQSLKARISDELQAALVRYRVPDEATTKIVSPKKIPPRLS